MEPRHRRTRPLAVLLAAAMVVGLIGPATAHRPKRFWEIQPRIKKHKTWTKHRGLRRLHVRWHQEHTETVIEGCDPDSSDGIQEPAEGEETETSAGTTTEQEAQTTSDPSNETGSDGGEEDSSTTCEGTPRTSSTYTARQHAAHHHRLRHLHLRRHHRMRTASRQKGKASWYDYRGRIGACGKPLRGLYAAHRTLPCGTRVAVRRGGKHVWVRVMDRGPFVNGWVIDLAPRAFRRLGGLGEGVIPVTVYRLKR